MRAVVCVLHAVLSFQSQNSLDVRNHCGTIIIIILITETVIGTATKKYNATVDVNSIYIYKISILSQQK